MNETLRKIIEEKQAQVRQLEKDIHYLQQASKYPNLTDAEHAIQPHFKPTPETINTLRHMQALRTKP
jgi:hypothetical protein